MDTYPALLMQLLLVITSPAVLLLVGSRLLDHLR